MTASGGTWCCDSDSATTSRRISRRRIRPTAGKAGVDDGGGFTQVETDSGDDRIMAVPFWGGRRRSGRTPLDRRRRGTTALSTTRRADAVRTRCARFTDGRRRVATPAVFAAAVRWRVASDRSTAIAPPAISTMSFAELVAPEELPETSSRHASFHRHSGDSVRCSSAPIPSHPSKIGRAHV